MSNATLTFEWIPAGDQTTASSRLRCFVPHEQLLARGVQSKITVAFHSEKPPTVVSTTAKRNATQKVIVVQKRVTREILDFVLAAKSMGNLIVYDVDDAGDALWYWAQPKRCFEMLKMADVVTTDTPERAAWLSQSMPDLITEVWPNPIDYGPERPTRFELRDRDPLRVLWFGSTSTTSSLEKYSSAIAAMRQVQLVVCTGTESNFKMDAEFVPWTLDSFVSTLQGCDLVCLMHDGSKYDRMKSNHKMSTSICWGVPAIVSRTPDYERTANQAGVPQAIFSNEHELVEAIEGLRTKEAREDYLDRSQQTIWVNHSPASCAMRLLEIVEQATVLNKPARRKSYWEKMHYAWWWTRISDNRAAAVRDLTKSLLHM